MIPRTWRWIGARSTGTAHLHARAGCDDFGACIEVDSPDGRALVVVTSDGAGSARLSRKGSLITSHAFCARAARHVSRCAVASIAEHDVESWLGDVRVRIRQAADRENAVPREFAATLVGAIVGGSSAIVAHVGDGACVYRHSGSAEWIVASWPAQGEYAATTYFVTDEEVRLVLSPIEGEIEEVAVFTDGLERLVLQFDSRTAFAPFFERVFEPLRRTNLAGRDRSLSRALKEFLDGPPVTDRTDDDKTLILARRSG